MSPEFTRLCDGLPETSDPSLAREKSSETGLLRLAPQPMNQANSFINSRIRCPALASIVSFSIGDTQRLRQGRIPMKKMQLHSMLCFALALVPASVHPQGMTEYGRSVGSIPQGLGPRAPGSVPQGGSGSGGVGEVTGKALPLRLVVAAKHAGLYPKQDDESERVAELSQGEPLVPMVQSSGGNDWYMVRTQKGLIGWVKSADVREEKIKK